MDESFEVSVYFFAEGFPSVAGITELLGVPPTSGWDENDRDPKPFLPNFQAENSYWELLGPKPTADGSLTAYLEALLMMLEPKKNIIKELSIKYQAGILCSCFFPDTCPSFKLNSNVLQRCGELNLSLEFDLKCIRPDYDAEEGYYSRNHINEDSIGSYLDKENLEEEFPF